MSGRENDVFVCELDDLQIAIPALAEVEGRKVTLVRVSDDEVLCVDDTCTHANVSLSEGEVTLDEQGCHLECWLHGSRFDLRTGVPDVLPATVPVATHQVTIEDGSVLVRLAETTPDHS